MEEKEKNKKRLLIIIAVFVVAVIIALVFILSNREEQEEASQKDESNWAEELSEAGLIPYNTSLSPYESAPFTVDFINVDRGDCTLVSCNGKHMLIDIGEADYYEVVRNFLINKGVECLDIVIASHPHSDHIGGMSRLFDDFEVVTFVMPEIKNHKELKNEIYENFIKELDAHSIKPKYPVVGEKLYLSDAEITILGPVKTDEKINNMSVVAMVEYGKKKFLFTGDAEIKAEELIIKSGADLDCDVLKVSHHGSKDSSGFEFIKETSPEIAVISVGEYNEYKHPNGKVLTNLLKEDVNIFRTDSDGTVSFYIESETSDSIMRNV